MGIDPRMLAAMGGSRPGPGARIRRLLVMGFGVIQVVLLVRVGIDLGILSLTGGVADFFVSMSASLAAPVKGLAGVFAGGAGVPGATGLDPVMLGALAGWTAIEGVVLSLLGRFL